MSMWITVAVFVAGTILGAIVKSIFEMTIRSWLERRAKAARKQKRKAKKAKRKLAARAASSTSINPKESL